MNVARVIFWNISNVWLMHVMFVIALVVFGFGLAQKISYLRAGKPRQEPWSHFGRRTLRALQATLLQDRVRGERYPAIFHGFIFYAFLMLGLASAAVVLDAFAGLPTFKGWAYLGLSLGADLGALVFLAGLGMAFWRRYVLRPPSRALTRTWDDALVLLLLFSIVCTGLLLEGMRIRYTGEPLPYFSPVGYTLSFLFRGMEERTGFSLHKALWWLHMLMAMSFIAIIPYTKLLHLVGIPANEFFARLQDDFAPGRADASAPPPAEPAEPAVRGIRDSRDFSWKDRLDHLACVQCGRCHAICPPTRAGELFSPMTFIATLRDYGLKVDPSMAHAEGDPDEDYVPPDPTEIEVPPVVPTALPASFAWTCLTCAACAEVCPAAIEHIEPFLEIRRHLVMDLHRLPQGGDALLDNLRAHGSPLEDPSARSAWMAARGMPIAEPGREVELLYWIGCLSSSRPEARKTAENLCALLERLGLDYAVLGDDERCCGDPARLLGDRELFEALARSQIEALQARSFKSLLVSCPHCLHVLRDEYRRFGVTLPVMHHAELIQDLVSKGILDALTGTERRLEKVGAWHDPCYLGRHAGLYDPPREALDRILSSPPLELADSDERSQCCGAGGGRFWLDGAPDAAVAEARLAQAEATGAEILVTACPYCEEGLRGAMERREAPSGMEIADLADLALSLLEASKPPPRA